MSGNTNNTVFIQKLFSSRDNFVDGNVQEATSNTASYVGQAGRIWWDPTRNNFYASDGSTPGGIRIGGGSGNGTVSGSNTWVQYNNNGNFGGSPTFTFDSSTGLLTAPYFSGDGSNLTHINASNITGTIANSNYANYANVANTANSVAGANVSGTVANANYAAYAGNITIASQPNITSIGTLGNLVVSGNSNANIINANYLRGDGSNITNLTLTGYAAGNTTEVQFNNNGNFDAVANFRFDKGSNRLYTDSVAIPVGTLLSGSQPIVYVIATLTLNQILANSDGTLAALPANSYGNPNEVPAPWAVFEFTADPSPALEVNDILSGAGVPVPSSVVYVGTGGNSNIVVTSSTFYGLPTPIPTNGTLVPVARQTLNAGLQISTQTSTDIVLTPGTGGGIIWAGNLIPLTTNEFTIGSPTRRIKQAYYGGGTIYIFDEYLGVDQSISANNGNLIIGGGTGLTVGEFIMSGNTLYLVNSAEDFNIGTPGATGNLNINRPITVSDSVGNVRFSVTSAGRTQIDTGYVLGNTPGALLINGSISGTYPNVSNPGGMLHIVGNESNASRITLDAVGPFAGSGAYSVITSRIARGSYTSPTATQAGDTFLRLSGVGYGTTGYPISGTTIELAASQNFTDSNAGSQINFYTTPLGNTGLTAKTLSAFITPNGLTIPNSSTRGTGTGAYNGNGGITFADDSYQNTAFNDTSAVTSVTVGVGLSQTATVGDVGIDATGVTTVAGTANQVYVNGNTLGGNSNAAITLTLPQNIDSGATLTFSNLTITGTLTAANFTSAGNSIIHDKILNLAYDSTSNAQIDGGGIILGNVSDSYTVSILYDLPNNSWNTDGAGFTTTNLLATNANIDYLNVQNGGHFGLVNEQLDYPNAYVQVDSNVNSYSQIVSQNHSPGTSASSDLVLVNDIGDDGNHYIDMGINGSNYTDPAFNSIVANDGYLFVNQGNLVIGTDTPGETIKFVAGGTTSNDIAVTISNTGISTPGNVTANYFVGNGSRLTGIVAGNITGQVANALVAGTVYTNAQPNITSVGTLTTLTVSGNITSGNANLGNVATANFFVGNGYGLTNINVSNVVGTIANANYAAYAGNLVNGLTINNSGTGAASGATFNGGSTLTISYNTVGAPKADGTGASGTWGISITGNANVANTANAVAGANVSGAVAFATTANSVAGANVSGQVSFAATANSVAGANVSGQVGNALVAGTVYTNSQPNITSVGTLTGFTSNGVVNFANTSNVTLGAVANLHISGGSANNILLTNGSGNLSWASISTVNGVGGNQLVFVLNAQQSIGNAKNTLLSLFGLTNGVTLATNTRYQYEILFNAQCSKAGNLSYALALGGGVAVAQHNYNVISNKTTAIDSYTAGITMMSQNATGAAITTAQTVADTATFTHTIIQGTIDVTTGGNVNFMVSQDQNTPVTWTINAGSYVRLMPLSGIGANTTAGTWS